MSPQRGASEVCSLSWSFWEMLGFFLVRGTGLVNEILLLLFFLLWWEVRRVGLLRPLWEWRKGQERFRNPCLHPVGLLWLNPGRRKLFPTTEDHIVPLPVSGEVPRKAHKNSFLGVTFSSQPKQLSPKQNEGKQQQILDRVWEGMHSYWWVPINTASTEKCMQVLQKVKARFVIWLSHSWEHTWKNLSQGTIGKWAYLCVLQSYLLQPRIEIRPRSLSQKTE